MSSFGWFLFRSLASVAPWPATLLDIARVTERNNAAAGITGMLVFSSSDYLQYLEGPAEAVEAAWARITADHRHRIVWHARGKTAARRFPGLPLGYFDAEREQSAVQQEPVFAARRDWRAAQADDLIAMLERIGREKYPAALSARDVPDV